MRGKADGDAEEEGLVRSYHLTGRFSFSLLSEGAGVAGRVGNDSRGLFHVACESRWFAAIFCGQS